MTGNSGPAHLAFS